MTATNTCTRSSNRPVSLIALLALTAGLSASALAESKVTLNDFYRPFELSEITPQNMQSWPYYRYTSMNWDEYGLFGTASIMAAEKPAKLRVAKDRFDIEQEFRDGQTFVESLTATQTKGFLIMKDSVILAEFYDNGFSREQTHLLQSSSKTYAGIIASKLIDDGLLDPSTTVDSYLDDFKGSKLAKATIQHVLDHQSGLLPAVDYHVPGGEAFMFEAEQGLKQGDTIGHRKAIINTKALNAPGEVYNYNDKNTDLLAILAAEVTGKPFNKLLSDLFNDFGATRNGSVALTVDGTASPSYGISCTLRDYALFHQWIAQGKAPKSFYRSIENIDKDLLSKSEKGQGLAAAFGTSVVYGSQTWILPDRKVVFSMGSYGQNGFSDLESGISVVFMQDWEDNGVTEKLVDNVAIALLVIEKLGSK